VPDALSKRWHLAAARRRRQAQKLVCVVAMLGVVLVGTACVHKRRAQPPLYPDYYGIAVGQQPRLNGEFKPHRRQNVTLLFADGRRILVPATAPYLPDTDTVGCRTESPERADGSCIYACRLQVGLATPKRARWVRQFSSSAACGRPGTGGTNGRITSVTSRWVVTQDGTAMPVRRDGKVQLACPSFNPTRIAATALQHKAPHGTVLNITLDAQGNVQQVTCQPSA